VQDNSLPYSGSPLTWGALGRLDKVDRGPRLGDQMLRIYFSCFLLAGALLSTGAAADDDLHMCIYENGDGSIEACNRAINSGRYSGVDLANAYINRAAELIA
jgi:hypothetical protein